MEYFMVIQLNLGSTAMIADPVRLPNFRKFSLQTAANITGPDTGGCAFAFWSSLGIRSNRAVSSVMLRLDEA